MASVKSSLITLLFSLLCPMGSIAASEEVPSSAPQDSRVLILDFGSQYSHLIARRVRELGMYSFVMPADVSLKRLKEFQPKAIIFSGGPFSVYDKDSPALEKEVYLPYRKKGSYPWYLLWYAISLKTAWRHRTSS